MTLNQEEIDAFNLRRQAAQKQVTWEFEMWRRQEYAAFEIEQQEREARMKDAFEKELQQQQLRQIETPEKNELYALYSKLQQALVKLQAEQLKTEQARDYLNQAQQAAQGEYQTAISKQKKQADQQRQLLVKRIAQQKAKQEEMKQRAEFFREEAKDIKERLLQDMVAYDEKRRQMLVDNGLARQLSEAQLEVYRIHDRIQDLTQQKTELQVYLERAARIEVLLQMKIQGLEPSDASDE